jgi:streptogramin lyase
MLGNIKFVRGCCGRALLVIALVLLAFSGFPLKAQNGNGINGLVKNAAGQPVEGALVRVSSTDLGLIFMVVSQAQGHYETPNLPPGKYTVEGIGGDHQSGRSGSVEVRSGQQANMDVQLSVVRQTSPPRIRMTQAEHAARMPEGSAKGLILTKCVLCHSLDGAVDTRTLRIEASRQQWEEVMGTHKYYMEDRPDAMSYAEVDMIVNYMTQYFSRENPRTRRREESPPPNPNRHLPRTLLTGTESNYVVMAFDLRPRAFPHDISVDSEGIAWFSEHAVNEFGITENGVPGVTKKGIGLIGRFDPKTFTYTQLAPPVGKFPARYSGAAVDPQGIVWSVDNGQNARLISYDPEMEVFKTYPMPAPPRRKEFDEFGLGDGSANMNTLTFQNGYVWGSGLLSGQIYRLDPASGGVITYPVPKGRPPYGLAFDKDQMLWYSAEFADEIVKLDPETGQRTHFSVVTPRADLRHIQTDADGNVWASAQRSDKLIRVDASTGQVTEYAPPTPLSGINSVDVDRENNLIWVAEAGADKIARFDPSSNTFVEFSLPSPGTGLKRIAIDPSNPQRIWWSATGSDRVGYIEVLE